VIIDLRRDVPMSEIRRYVDGLGLSFFGRWLTLLTFRFMLLKRAYTKPELESMLGGIGFYEGRGADGRTGYGGLVREVEGRTAAHATASCVHFC